MVESDTLFEVVNMAKAVKDVGKMVDEFGSQNGHGEGLPDAVAGSTSRNELNRSRKKKATATAGINGNGELSDIYDNGLPMGQHVSSRAPACYASAMEHMAELTIMQGKVAYATRVNESAELQIVERAKRAISGATSKGILRPFHAIAPKPVQPLEALVQKEITVMAAMQKQVSLAVHHSEGVVEKLEAYDAELLIEFDKAKSHFCLLEKSLAETHQGISSTAEKLKDTAMDDECYVPHQVKLNNLRRKEKETRNMLEARGQQIVDTYKQSAQIRSKEDVVRAGLHELRLVNSYVSRFLGFVQRTREADDLLPQLVETAEAVTNAYQILTGIVVAGSAATTEAVETLVNVIGTVDYRVLPNVQKEVNKQKAVLEKADRKTSFYEQAVRLLRGEEVYASIQQSQPEQSYQQDAAPFAAAAK